MTTLMTPPGIARMSKNNTDAPAASGRPTVLVVDDEKDLVELISYNLQRNGYDVLTAATGDAALAVAARDRPSLVLLDLMLPGLSGTEVARRLRADPRTAGIPIIMLTAKSEETDVVVGLTLGADDYVTKPFSMKILLARLAGVLRRAEAAAAPPPRLPTTPPPLCSGPARWRSTRTSTR